MKKIRHSVIGLGFFGEYHAQIAADMPGVELAAVCTRTSNRLNEIAEKYDVARKYTDYHKLLADPDIDSVSIVTHYHDHREIAVAALQSGKSVLLEKPMADTSANCQAIIKAAEKSTGIFMVGHICRFDPRVYGAKRAIDAGQLGKITYMYARRNLSYAIGRTVLDKISPLMGDGLHDTDVMLWLSGEKIKNVYAQNVRMTNHKYPDISTAVYRFHNGATGVIENVWHLPDNTPFAIDARMEIIGTGGAVYIDCGNTGLIVNDKKGVDFPDTAYWPELYKMRVGALHNEMEYFFNCVRNGTVPEIVTPAESLYVVEVMCAAEKSAALGEIVTLC